MKFLRSRTSTKGMQVNENRRHIRDLTNEVVKILYNLAKLTRGHEDMFRGPELLSALENLKA
jgi:hypothetical protein